MIKLFVGLGNPGAEYEATRHNAGFWWVDALARDLKLHLAIDKGYHGLVARATVHGQTVWLLEPQTFMNLSGQLGGGAGALLQDRARRRSWWCTTNSTSCPARPSSSSAAATPATTACATSTPSWAPATTGACASASAIPGVKSEVIELGAEEAGARPARGRSRTASIARLKAVPAMLAGEMDKATLIVHTSKPPRPKPPRPPEP